MKNLLIINILVLLFVWKGWSQNADRKGALFLNELPSDKAKAYFQQKLKDLPNDISAMIDLGDLYLTDNKPDSAKKLYQKAFNLNPQNAFALVGLGKVALMSNDRINEAGYFDRARRADKMNPEVYCAIAEGCIRLQKKDTVTAMLFINQGLNVNQKYAKLHLATGDLETLKKNYGLAANAYDRAIFFDPGLAVAYRNRGYIDLLSHDFKNALIAFNKSIAMEPDQVLVYKYLGECYYATAKYPEAEKAYQSYISGSSPTTDDLERLAIVLFFNKKYKESEALLERVMKANHEESVLLRIRGYIAYETGDYAKGLEYMNKFFALHNSEKLISTDYIYYAKILQNSGKEKQAIESYEKALLLDPSKTGIYEELARLSAKNGMHREAALFYKKMIENGADKLSISFLIGKEYFFDADSWQSRFDSLMELHRKGNVPFGDSSTVKERIRLGYMQADSAFTVVNRMSSDYAGGYIWKGRIQSLIDTEAEHSGAKEAYEKALTILLKGDPMKNRKSIIECYKYLGSWYWLGYDRLYKSDRQKSAEMRSKTMEYFSKILELDPTDAQAKEVLRKMAVKK